MSNDVEHLFSVLISNLYIFLEKCLFKSLAHFLIGLFVFLLLSRENSLYILVTIIYMICKYFSPFCSLLFTFWIVSSDTQKVLIWMKSNLSLLSFLACAFGAIFKRQLSNPRS